MSGYRTSIRVHGKTQLELKNRYPLTADTRNSLYTLEAYLFTPAQLGINGKRYGVEQFFSDMKSNTRFSIAHIPLSHLIDPACSVSPLTRITSYLEKAPLASDLDEQRIIYELRTLANLFTAEMKATFQLLSSTAGKGTSAALQKKAKRFLQETQRFLTEFRELHTRFLEPAISSNLRTALQLADESISLSAQKTFFHLHRIFPQEDIARETGRCIETEKAHREEMGYPSTIRTGEDAELEQILYRESILKKWAQTVLYMSSEETGTNRKIGHILASVAAAIAMSFAVIATFFAEQFYASYSVPWALIIVVSYMLKDRIKEILRGVLIRVMPRFIADRTERIIDRVADSKVGKTRSMMRIIHSDDAPKNVRDLRNATGPNPFRSILPPENVVHFRKDVHIDNRKLLKEHSRVEAVAEIIRIKMDNFLKEMDPTKKAHHSWKDGNPFSVKGRRVYHINLILVLSSHGEEQQLYRYRLVLNRQEIRRIQEVRA